MAYIGRECDVVPYTVNYESVKVEPIVTATTAWTCQEIVKTCILVIHEALWMGESMPNSLINPNQIRAYGWIVQDIPYCGSPLYCEDADAMLAIPLELLIQITAQQWEHQHKMSLADADALCEHHNVSGNQLVSRSLLHDEGSNKTKRDEGSVQDDDARTGIEAVWRRIQRWWIFLALEQKLSDLKIAPPTRDAANVWVSDLPASNTFISGDRKSDVNPKNSARRWLIGFDAQMLQKTTQRLVRSAVLPLERRDAQSESSSCPFAVFKGSQRASDVTFVCMQEWGDPSSSNVGRSKNQCLSTSK